MNNGNTTPPAMQLTGERLREVMNAPPRRGVTRAMPGNLQPREILFFGHAGAMPAAIQQPAPVAPAQPAPVAPVQPLHAQAAALHLALQNLVINQENQAANPAAAAVNDDSDSDSDVNMDSSASESEDEDNTHRGAP